MTNDQRLEGILKAIDKAFERVMEKVESPRFQKLPMLAQDEIRGEYNCLVSLKGRIQELRPAEGEKAPTVVVVVTGITDYVELQAHAFASDDLADKFLFANKPEAFEKFEVTVNTKGDEV